MPSTRAPALDPNNPLSAIVQPFKAPGAAAAPAVAQAQVIEVDEAAVHQARSGGFKRGIVAGVIFGAVLAVLGYFGGSASTQSAARAQGVRDAHDLSGDLGKAKEALDQLKNKVQEGGKSLLEQHQFPASLAQDLAGVNVDFAGDKLFGRRFSGVPADTTRELFDFITRVQALNDKKTLVIALLNKLQKPITEEFARPAGSVDPAKYAVVLDGNTATSGTILAPLVTPVAPPGDAEITFVTGSGNHQLPRFDLGKPAKDGAAVAVIQQATFEKVCPSSQHGQIAQLMSTMNSLNADIEGQKPDQGGDAVTESKPGLAEIASKLSDALSKVE
jgi:hypothetical protein